MRFIWVPEKVPGKFLEGALVQSQVKFNKVPERVPEKVWEALVQTQLRYFQPLGALERFVKIKRCGCWGYHPSLFPMPWSIELPWHAKKRLQFPNARLA